jgi:hypothetical protein
MGTKTRARLVAAAFAAPLKADGARKILNTVHHRAAKAG